MLRLWIKNIAAIEECQVFYAKFAIIFKTIMTI